MGPYLNGKKRYASLLVFSLLVYFVIAAVMIVLAFLSVHAYILALTWITLHAFSFLFLYLFILRKESEEKAASYEETDVQEYGILLSIITIPSTILFYAERLFVFHILGAPALALYSIALIFPSQLRGIAKNIQSIALPSLSNKQEFTQKKDVFRMQYYASFLILLSGSAVLFVVLPYLYQIFFPQYVHALFFTRLLIIVILFESLASVFLSVLRAQRATKLLFFLNTAQVVVGTPLILFGLFKYGMTGFIIIKGILSLLMLLLTWLSARRVIVAKTDMFLSIDYPWFKKALRLLR